MKSNGVITSEVQSLRTRKVQALRRFRCFKPRATSEARYACFRRDFIMHQFVLGYFDPGSGSILLQVIVGGFAGVMLLFRYAWQGVRQKFLGSPVESDR